MFQGELGEFSSLGLQGPVNARGLGDCRTDLVTFLCIPNITALSGSAMLVTAPHKDVLCNGHN